MSRINISNDIFQDKHNDFFKGLYNRNKKLLTVSAIIFFASIIIGVLIGYFLADFMRSFLTIFADQLRSQVEISTVSIFMHNLRAALITYIGGVIGIVPALALFGNGFVLGSLVGYLMHGGILNHSSLNLVDILSYILPHGIFEIPAYIITGAAGFRLTTVITGSINNRRGKTYSDNHQKFKDSLALLAIAVILFVIAAIIEANFTIPIGNYITGLHVHG